MDFDDSPEERAYRLAARSWLSAHANPLPPGRPTTVDGGEGDWFAELPAARAWLAAKYDAGYNGITWPKSWGGQGGTPMQEIIFQQEEATFEVPASHTLKIIHSVCLAPMLLFGTDDLKRLYIPRALRADDIWAQLFSEPSAGSDMANLRTSAVRDGDDWVVNGHKIWNTAAHYADYGLLFTRTDPTVAKHKGLTVFFVDLKNTKGIEIHPIRQMTGVANFNEVFFTDVRIPDSNRLGAVDDGWSVMMATMMFERASSMYSHSPRISHLMRLARTVDIEGRPALADDVIRARIAEFYVLKAGRDALIKRTLTDIAKKGQPGSELSALKLMSGLVVQELAVFAMDMMQMGGALQTDVSGESNIFLEDYLAVPAVRISAGADEIQRTIIGEQVLKLPPEPRPDRNVPFNKL